MKATAAVSGARMLALEGQRGPEGKRKAENRTCSLRVGTLPHDVTVTAAARAHVMDPNVSQRSRSAAQLRSRRAHARVDRAVTRGCQTVLQGRAAAADADCPQQ
jgi:hypothetical protein